MNFYYITACVFGGLLLLGVLLYTYKIHFWKYGKRKQKPNPPSPQDKRYAILIPARDESKVIGELLDSIAANSYNQQNLHTYVMVSREDDPTIEICKNYANTTCWCIDKPTKSKGDVLSQLVTRLYSAGERFDGYYIFDADNVLLPNFIELTHNALQNGNDVVLGARLNKRPSARATICGSTLTWTYLNTLNNKCRSENGQNILVQGSPLLVSKTIIEDFWHGNWPLCSLTEDYELGFVCSLNNFKSYYCEDAKAYDEQPDTYSSSAKQRLRWIKGHNQVDFKYLAKFRRTKCKYNSGIYKYDAMCSLMAPIIILVAAILFSLFSVVCAIVFGCMGNPLWQEALMGFVFTLFGIYALLGLWTAFGIWIDKDILNLNIWQRIGACFVVPFFFASYLPIYIKSFFIKDVIWKKVDHHQCVKDQKKEG